MAWRMVYLWGAVTVGFICYSELHQRCDYSLSTYATAGLAWPAILPFAAYLATVETKPDTGRCRTAPAQIVEVSHAR